MNQLTVGMLAPDFTLSATGGQTITLSQYRGKKVILYFYPKDNTPGWTDEAREFREKYGEVNKLGAVIIGVSRDSIASHEKFAAKLELPFLLVSDSTEAVCKLYDVLKEKNMYGKKVIGIERSTFILNEEGSIVAIYRKVKVAGHVKQVIDFLQTL